MSHLAGDHFEIFALEGGDPDVALSIISKAVSMHDFNFPESMKPSSVPMPILRFPM